MTVMKHTDFTPDYLTELNLSRKLAVSIGWAESDLGVISKDDLRIRVITKTKAGLFDMVHVDWEPFSYLDPHIIYKIAQAYDCFPSAQVSGDYAKAKANKRPTILGWECLIWSYKHNQWNKVEAPTPEMAIALAVINRDIKNLPTLQDIY